MRDFVFIIARSDTFETSEAAARAFEADDLDRFEADHFDIQLPGGCWNQLDIIKLANEIGCGRAFLNDWLVDGTTTYLFERLDTGLGPVQLISCFV